MPPLELDDAIGNRAEGPGARKRVHHRAVGRGGQRRHRVAERPEDLDPLDRVDPEVGLQVKVQLQHLARVAGPVADDLDEAGRDRFPAQLDRSHHRRDDWFRGRSHHRRGSRGGRGR